MNLTNLYKKYLKQKESLEATEEKLFAEVRTKVKKSICNIGMTDRNRTLDSLSLDDDKLVFNYRIVNYDESEPATLVLN